MRETAWSELWTQAVANHLLAREDQDACGTLMTKNDRRLRHRQISTTSLSAADDLEINVSAR